MASAKLRLHLVRGVVIVIFYVICQPFTYFRVHDRGFQQVIGVWNNEKVFLIVHDTRIHIMRVHIE